MVPSTPKGLTSCTVRSLMLLALFALSACVATLSTSPKTMTRSSYRHLRELPDTTTSALSENRINSYYDSLKAMAQQLEVGILTAIDGLFDVLLAPIGRPTPKKALDMIEFEVMSSLPRFADRDYYYNEVFKKLLATYGESQLESLINHPDLVNNPIRDAMNARLQQFRALNRSPAYFPTSLNVEEVRSEVNSVIPSSLHAM
ncbi:hypothetical protein CCR75_006920 [Bremia lactucae]|uniref:RxLR effector protein n=1 Tax=Bremia lactucae TaxID=4779 RepID=A0A976FHX7_BRELC|nr:hypothetical protein CCR75_004523 [Bremia lactucae]TDH67152.1 hypothetical protein CCR75_006920 [Bremia lactucae]